MSKSTLIIRLEGVLQSYGDHSDFDNRDTCPEPTKSAVIGLLRSAMGASGDETVDGVSLHDLANLRMAVRVDKIGGQMEDFHTVLGSRRVNEDIDVHKFCKSFAEADYYSMLGKKGVGDAKRTIVSRRSYLVDAKFFVALTGERDILEKLNKALSNPKWLPSLGRKCCVISAPIWTESGVVNESDPVEALRKHPGEGDGDFRFVFDSDQGDIRQDVPLSFKRRQFASRYVETGMFGLVGS